MADPLRDKDQAASGGVGTNVLPSASGTVRERMKPFSSNLKLDQQVENAGVRINPAPELDQSAERAFEAPPIVETERKETITSAPSITVQTSVQKETITSLGSAKTYVVSRDELAGKDPDKDSIVGLHKVEEFEEDKELKEAA